MLLPVCYQTSDTAPDPSDSEVSIVVLFYEYFLTLGDEAKYFWNGKFTGASAIFFFNRYIPLTLNMVGLTDYASMSDKVCRFNISDLISYMMLILLVRCL